MEFIRGMGCYFLSGTSPNEACTRLMLHAASTMLREKERRVDFRFGEDDEVAGEGSISSAGEFVVLGGYAGIKCDCILEFGPRRYTSCVLITPSFDSEIFLKGGAFVRIPIELLYPDRAPPVAEA